jgi:hypothetical protein
MGMELNKLVFMDHRPYEEISFLPEAYTPWTALRGRSTDDPKVSSCGFTSSYANNGDLASDEELDFLV